MRKLFSSAALAVALVAPAKAQDERLELKVGMSSMSPDRCQPHLGHRHLVGRHPGQNGGPATHVGGTWLNVVALQGNDWKLSADTWNMMPPPPAKEATK
jgi:hypothetical protein